MESRLTDLKLKISNARVKELINLCLFSSIFNNRPQFLICLIF